MSQILLNNLHEAKSILDQFISNTQALESVHQAGIAMVNAIQNGGKIISCGNGGSMCDAMHFAEELSGKFREDRRALPALSISDASHMSCVGNDYGYNEVFARYLEALGQPNDILLAISTSGNSTNVIRAMEVAKSKGIKIVALTGKDGGKMAALADIEVRAPYSKFADRAQEIHIKVIHALIQTIEHELQLTKV